MKLKKYIVFASSVILLLSCHCIDKDENYRMFDLMIKKPDSLEYFIKNGKIRYDSLLFSKYIGNDPLFSLKEDKYFLKKYYSPGYKIVYDDTMEDENTCYHDLVIQSLKDTTVIVRFVFKKKKDKGDFWKFVGTTEPSPFWYYGDQE